MQGKLLFCHIHTLGLGFDRNVVIVPELCLPVCPGNCLTYLGGFGFSSPPGEAGTGVAKFFLIYSAVLLICYIFQMFCHSFVCLPPFFLSFALLYVISSLLTKLLFTGSDGESFYSFTFLPPFQCSVDNILS
jgi:hypothetical protein